jgi:F420-non-reducing hydrogenase small subunit
VSKPKVGFYWCASCGGCEEAVVDLAEAILDVVEAVDIVFWPCAMDFKREDLEAMSDGEMAACFVNGAVRTSEQREMAELCRRKSGLLVAFGSCSQSGGIPGLANLYSLESILETAYGNDFSNVNPEGTRPRSHIETPEGDIELPTMDESVKSLDQVIDVDYYLPGCAPPVKLIVGAVTAILEGNLPPKGSVLAPDMAQCKECSRIDSKPEESVLREFRRPHEVEIDQEKCFLAQGLLCLGPATRSGCDHACIDGNMPCTGCLGAIDGVRDYGAAALSATASLVDLDAPEEVAAAMDGVVDPAGTFYRYSLPQSMLFRRVQDTAGEKSS